ncbi:cartilage intermediate layer protein 1-like [Saccoglossus kowalevskii]|uniref:Cartilage intermediate layer protein 1-like n=1 Tax=Saccoglossus kowalevskii TaxID=10224 RepID=A0ABM0MZT5_SACKO|nr:PREDICTED: cartilage intermediate layer protein 1-like [Saccoglossus kowalevskii]
MNFAGLLVIYVGIICQTHLLGTAAQDECSGWWTNWFNHDGPSGLGDYETTSFFVDHLGNDMCSDPTGVQAQTVDGVAAEDTGEIFSDYSPEEGFVCLRADQPDNECYDYEVRFCCPA